jgi:XTP/dITP diphosphohydrolase
MQKRILIATNNAGKVRELQQLLEAEPIELLSLSDVPGVREVDETGDTFAENARLKAIGYALQTGLPALADDSGLEIDALGGRPGVLSARYGGENTSFDEKMRKVLAELAGVPGSLRTARFACALAIADDGGNVLFETSGICAGRIADEPRGAGGFGYDPIFIPDGFDRTFGELEDGVKREISHRAIAFRQIIPFLRHFNAV